MKVGLRSNVMLFIQIFILLCLLSCIRGHENSGKEEFYFHDVTVPYIRGQRYRRDTGTLHQNGHVKKTELAFEAFTKRFIVDLHLNRELIADSYIEKHFEGDTEVIRKPKDHSRTHCYYHGVVRGIPGSVVAISTCNGVSGMIDDGREIYYIHPIKNSNHGKHYVFRETDRKPTNFSCGVEDSHDHSSPYNTVNHMQKHIRLKRSIHGPYDSNSKSRYVELYIVNDLRQYDNFKKDKYAVIARTKEVINIVNALYRPLNIYIALVGVEIWASEDRIYVVENAEKTMNNFLKYRRDYINPKHKNDNAQLLTGAVFNDGVVGKAVKGPICTYQYSGGVNMDRKGVVATGTASIVAHEMGHNFGMEHDKKGCSCPAKSCIMTPTMVVGGMNPIRWSSCSKQYLADAFEAGMDYCLQDLPDKIYNGPVCGNSFVEPGEECDCGLEEECNSLCCNPATCKLFNNATCATGKCCDLNTCQYKKASTLCRPATSECDLPEYCKGNNEYCPADVYVVNGEPCNYKQSYCYNGKCNSHDKQCKLLWGHTAKNSESLCYTMLNPDGIANGNCGFHWLNMSFSKCAPRNVLCGMLHCVHRNEKLEFWKEANSYLMPETFISASGGKRIPCKSAILDVGLYMPDPGMVPDGSSCGKDSMCMNRQCRRVADLKFPRCYMGCSGNGICNTNGNCHCNAGWAPPLCDRAGSGGSQDSGPAGDYDEPEHEEPGDKSLMISLLIIFLVILPLIVVLVAFSYKYRKFLIQMWRRRSYMAKSPFQKAKPVVRRSDSSASNTGRPPVKRMASLPGGAGSLPRDISAPVFQSTTMKAANEKMMDIRNPEIRRPDGTPTKAPLLSHPVQYSGPPARPAPTVPPIAEQNESRYPAHPLGPSRPIPHTRFNNNLQKSPSEETESDTSSSFNNKQDSVDSSDISIGFKPEITKYTPPGLKSTPAAKPASKNNTPGVKSNSANSAANKGPLKPPNKATGPHRPTAAKTSADSNKPGPKKAGAGPGEKPNPVRPAPGRPGAGRPGSAGKSTPAGGAANAGGRSKISALASRFQESEDSESPRPNVASKPRQPPKWR